MSAPHPWNVKDRYSNRVIASYRLRREAIAAASDYNEVASVYRLAWICYIDKAA